MAGRGRGATLPAWMTADGKTLSNSDIKMDEQVEGAFENDGDKTRESESSPRTSKGDRGSRSRSRDSGRDQGIEKEIVAESVGEDHLRQRIQQHGNLKKRNQAILM